MKREALRCSGIEVLPEKFWYDVAPETPALRRNPKTPQCLKYFPAAFAAG
jgi:hypothetical protein